MADETIAYQKTGLIGGGNNLDGVDGRVLKDGDFAYIMLSGNIQYNYMLDAASAQVEKVPFIIKPDVNADNKRWILQTPYVAYVDATAPDQGASTAEGYRSLKDLLDKIGLTKKATIVCPSTGSGNTTTYTFITSETVPANITLIAEEGAFLQFDNGVILTQNGPFKHGLSKCFTWTGTGKISFGSGTVKEVYSEWWGETTTAGIKEADSSLPASGGIIRLSEATYATTVPYVISKNVTLRGAGKCTSIISYNGLSDAIQSTWPINSSTAVNINIEDVGIIATNGLNAGAGFADVCGTYVNINRCQIEHFKYGIIFDQTEIGTITKNVLSGNSTAQLWFVNDASHTAGAFPGFTNGISVIGNQFNAAATAALFLLDGNVNINIERNNFNGGSYGIVSKVGNPRIVGNNFEGQALYSIWLRDYTRYDNGIYCHNEGFVIEGNGFAAAGVAQQTQIMLSAGYMGRIEYNRFDSATVSAIAFDGDLATGVKIANNSNSADTPILIASGVNISQNNLAQLADTHCDNAILAPGEVNVEPASMYGIYIGSRLWCVNVEGASCNGEVVVVSLVTALNFRAVFTSTKTAAFKIKGIDNSNIMITMADAATPSVSKGAYNCKTFLTGGVIAITDFTDGVVGQQITIIAEHGITITDGTNIFLNGSANWAMLATDTLTLVCKADNKWYEISRGDNGA